MKSVKYYTLSFQTPTIRYIIHEALSLHSITFIENKWIVRTWYSRIQCRQIACQFAYSKGAPWSQQFKIHRMMQLKRTTLRISFVPDLWFMFCYRKNNRSQHNFLSWVQAILLPHVWIQCKRHDVSWIGIGVCAFVSCFIIQIAVAPFTNMV